MPKKLIEVILTCGRCKEKRELEFDVKNHNRLSEYFTDYPEQPERYRLYRSDALPKGKRLTILCPDCYGEVEAFDKNLQEDTKEKLREFVRGEE